MEKLDVTKKILIGKLSKSQKGYKLYRKIIKSYDIKKEDPIIVLPSGDKECTYYTLLHLDQYIEQLLVKPSGVFIITDIVNIESYCCFNDKIKKIIRINNAKLDQLLHYYSCSDVLVNMVVGSIILPQSRIGHEYIGYKDITKKDLVTIGILKIK